MGWVSGYLGTGLEGWGTLTEWGYMAAWGPATPRLPGAVGVRRPDPPSVTAPLCVL